jgi:cyclase
MLAKRVIPCLDTMKGRVVKGIHFKELRDAGDPAIIASTYYAQGADEIVLLDITASYEERDILRDVVERVSDVIFIPLTVGGGIRSLDDISMILSSGADKIAINTAAVQHPALIRMAARTFGSQCIVSSIDVKRVYVSDGSAVGKTVLDTPQGRCWWSIYVYGGRRRINVDALAWARRVVELGAGEIMVSSLDYDGTKQGYDLPLLRGLSKQVSVPIIASSGAGTLNDILQSFLVGTVDAALAASIFHYGTYTIQDVKEYLAKHNVLVRLATEQGVTEFIS